MQHPHRAAVEVRQVPVDGGERPAQRVAPVGEPHAAGPAGLLLEEAADPDRGDGPLVAQPEPGEARQCRGVGSQPGEVVRVEPAEPAPGGALERGDALGHVVEDRRLEAHVAVEHLLAPLGVLGQPDAPARAAVGRGPSRPVARGREEASGRVDDQHAREALGVVLEVAPDHVVGVAEPGRPPRPAGQQEPGVLDGAAPEDDDGGAHDEPPAVDGDDVHPRDPGAEIVEPHLGDVGQRDDLDAVARAEARLQEAAEPQRLGVIVEDQRAQVAAVEPHAVLGLGRRCVVQRRRRPVEQGGRPLVASPQVLGVEGPARVGDPGPRLEVDGVERGLAAGPRIGRAPQPALAAGLVDVPPGAVERGEGRAHGVGRRAPTLEDGDAEAPAGQRQGGRGPRRAGADDAYVVVELRAVGEPPGVMDGQWPGRPIAL